MKKHTNKKGFTLVELVIVIAVIAVLAAVLIPTFAGIIERARENSKMQRATAARDELLELDSVTSIQDLKNCLIKVDDTYYIIGDNGKITRLGTDIDAIKDELGIDFSDEENHTSGGATIITPVSSTTNSNLNAEASPLDLDWKDLVEFGYVDTFTDNGKKVLGRIDRNVMLNNLVIGNEVDTLSFTALAYSNIKKITIPKTLTGYIAYDYLNDIYEMGNPYFCYSLCLTEIVVEEGNPVFYTDGLGLYYNGALVLYALGSSNSSYTVKSNYTAGGSNHTVDTIAPNVFDTCEKMTPVALTIPSSVTHIYFNSFDRSALYFDMNTQIAYMSNGSNKFYYAVDYVGNNELMIDDRTEVIASWFVHDTWNSFIIERNLSMDIDNPENRNQIEQIDVNLLGIGRNVRYIASDAFALAKIYNFALNTENTNCSVSPDGRCLINGTRLIAYANGFDADNQHLYRIIGYTAVTMIDSRTLDLTGSGITEIGVMTFFKNGVLLEIILPDTLELINTCAFCGMYPEGGYTIDVVIPDNDSTRIKVANSAFSNCGNDSYRLEVRLNTFSKFTEIGDNAFLGTTLVRERDDNPDHIFTFDLENATSIGACAFADVKLRCDSNDECYWDPIDVEITFGNHLTSIGDYAFQIYDDNEYLGTVKAVTIPASIKNYGSEVFYYNIEGLTFENGGTSGFSTYGNGLYLGTTLVGVINKDIEGPFEFKEGTTEIAPLPHSFDPERDEYTYSPFYGVSVERIEIPSTVTTLRSYAIAGVYDLRELVLNEGLITIEPYAIFIENIDMNNNENNFVKEIIIPDSVETIGYWGILVSDQTWFDNGYNETCYDSYAKIAPKDGSTKYATDADLFYSDEYPDEYYYSYIYNVQTGRLLYVNPVFSGSFTTAGSTITEIPDYAFWGTHPNMIELPGVTTLGNYVFENCYGDFGELEIDLSTQLTTITENTFKNCPSAITIYNYEYLEDLYNNPEHEEDCDELADAYFNNHVNDLNEQFEIVDNCCLVNKISHELVFVGNLNFNNYRNETNDPISFTTEGTSIQIIPKFAFMGIPNLSMVVLKDVTGIGAYAFAYTNIQTVFLPDTIDYISPDAFKDVNSGNLMFITYDFYNMVETMSDEELDEHGAELDAYMDTRIKTLNDKFNIVDNSTLVDITNGIILHIDPTISEFSTFETGITKIRAYDFAECLDLEILELYDVTEIDAFAFNELNLSTLYIDSTITSINSTAFYHAQIEIIEIEQNNYFGTNYDRNFVYDKTTKEIMYINPNITVFNTGSGQDEETGMPTGSTITEITENYFANFQNRFNIGDFDSVVLAGVQTIDANAFTNSVSIGTLVIFDSTTSIDETAFVTYQDTCFINRIMVDPSNTHYASNIDGSVLFDKSDYSIMFMGNCNSFTTEGINGEATITTITPYFFYGMRFTDVYLYGVETIEDNAFSYARIDNTLYIGASVTSISPTAFINLDKYANISEIIVDEENTHFALGKVSNTENESNDILLYNKTTGQALLSVNVYENDLYDDPRKTFTSAEYNLTELSAYLFHEDHPTSDVYYSTMDLLSVTRIHDYAFTRTSVSTLKIYDTVQIDDLAFYNASIYNIILEEDTNPNHTKKLYIENITDPVTNETGIYLHDGNGKLIFISCNIENFNCEDHNITELGSCSLTNVNVNNFDFYGVTKIDDYAFAYSVFNNVYIPATVNNLAPRAFDMFVRFSNNYDYNIYLDEDNETYSMDENGLIYQKSQGNDYYKLVCAPNAFFNGDVLTLHEDTKVIGHYAFTTYYEGVESVALPEGLLTIESYAFYGCSNIEILDIPSTVTSIGSYAFAECYGLYIIAFEHTQATNLFTGAINVFECFNYNNLLEYNDHKVSTYIYTKPASNGFAINVPETDNRTYTIVNYSGETNPFEPPENESAGERIC